MADLVERLRAKRVRTGLVANWVPDPDAQEAADEIERLRALQGWRDIESAPKDGTVFLAFSQDLTGSGLDSFMSTCAWHQNAGFCTCELREPTHWQPLPPPPEQADG